MEALINRIADFAASNPDGFTVDLNLNPVDAGYCVALSETQNSFGIAGLEKVVSLAKQNNYCVGGWYDKESGKYYYDCTIVVNSLEKALLYGQLNNQIAIFNLNACQEIRL